MRYEFAVEDEEKIEIRARGLEFMRIEKRNGWEFQESGSRETPLQFVAFSFIKAVEKETRVRAGKKEEKIDREKKKEG